MKKEFQKDRDTWEVAYSSPSKNKVERTLPRILVVDDDPLFRAKVAKIAEKRGLSVTTCASIRELSAVADSRLFDVVVVDYFLDDLQEFLTGTDIARVLEGLPIVLISNNDRAFTNNDPWPTSIRKFVNKKAGIDAILDTAIQIKEGARA